MPQPRNEGRNAVVEADTAWLDKVGRVLKPLEAEYGKSIWRDITPEQRAARAHAVADAVQIAKEAVLLVSPKFSPSELNARQDPALLRLRLAVTKALAGKSEAMLGLARSLSVRRGREDFADEEFQLVGALREHLFKLVDGESDLTLLGIHALDTRGQGVLLMLIFIDPDGHVLVEVCSNLDLPQQLRLSDAKLSVLDLEFAAEQADDGRWVIDHGPIDQNDAEELCVFVCALIDQVFELPNDSFSLIARHIDE